MTRVTALVRVAFAAIVIMPVVLLVLPGKAPTRAQSRPTSPMPAPTDSLGRARAAMAADVLASTVTLSANGPAMRRPRNW